jgi:hypothetical protein
MGWEIRNGKRVYYRKVREGGRVRSVYCGAGERGRQAAREDSERRGAKRRPRVKLFRRPKRPMLPPMVVVPLPVTALAPPPEPPPVSHRLTLSEQRNREIKAFLEWKKRCETARR